MQTGKSLGFKKGDFVYTGAFPAIIISDVHTFAPCCEVWGFEHESGSAYAKDLRKLSYEQFTELCKQNGHEFLTPYSEVAKRAIHQAQNPELIPA